MYKRWCQYVLSAFFAILFFLGGITILIDPFFHYHAPIDSLQYPIDNERYQNDGIIRHFRYNAIITGSSMTENFKTTEFDMLFGVKSIKIPFSGGSYKEINDNMQRAVVANPDISVILRCLDYNRLLDPKDKMRDTVYPTYLYDNHLFNDVQYIFNKTILLDNTLGVLEYTRDGGLTTTFDEYVNWMSPDLDMRWTENYVRTENKNEIIDLSDEDKKNIYENIEQNVTVFAENNPQIDLYIFFSPYSIYYWDSLKQEGTLERQLQAEKYAIELLLQYENIHLYSFFDDFELVCNLDNYKDPLHYMEHVNSLILDWIHEGRHHLTKENYLDYYNNIYKFYTAYNYDALFDN